VQNSHELAPKAQARIFYIFSEGGAPASSAMLLIQRIASLNIEK
jgi:hypothetical protein